MRRLRGGEIGMIFQDPMTSLNPLLTIEKQLSEPLRIHLKLSKKSARERVVELMRRTEISAPENRLRQYPHELSGGQIQRISVARALISGPGLILADEPVSMVDASLRMAIVNLFKNLRDGEGVSVLYITHDLATAYYISDRIAIMLRGFVV